MASHSQKWRMSQIGGSVDSDIGMEWLMDMRLFIGMANSYPIRRIADKSHILGDGSFAIF